MHNGGMNSHQDIIRRVGAEQVAALTGRPITTVRSWDQRGSIPAPQWKVLIDGALCTADELIDGASERAA